MVGREVGGHPGVVAGRVGEEPERAEVPDDRDDARVCGGGRELDRSRCGLGRRRDRRRRGHRDARRRDPAGQPPVVVPRWRAAVRPADRVEERARPKRRVERLLPRVVAVRCDRLVVQVRQLGGPDDDPAVAHAVLAHAETVEPGPEPLDERRTVDVDPVHVPEREPVGECRRWACGPGPVRGGPQEVAPLLGGHPQLAGETVRGPERVRQPHDELAERDGVARLLEPRGARAPEPQASRNVLRLRNRGELRVAHVLGRRAALEGYAPGELAGPERGEVGGRALHLDPDRIAGVHPLRTKPRIGVERPAERLERRAVRRGRERIQIDGEVQSRHATSLSVRGVKTRYPSAVVGNDGPAV